MNAANLGRGLVILDRDGVINRDSDGFIKNTAEWQPLPGSIEAIAALTAAGFTLAVASNQSGLARGLFFIPTQPHIKADVDARYREILEAFAALGLGG